MDSSNNKLLNWLKQKSALVQSSAGSFKRHNGQYEQPGALEEARRHAAYNEEHDTLNNEEFKLGMLLEKHPQVSVVAVDIGSGVGCNSATLSKRFKKVFSMEPSAAAIEIAKILYPPANYPNIEWRQGFAEEVLRSLSLDQPALFFTGVVLSHLRDAEVATICRLVNKLALPGSLICFNDCWGPEFHQLMWHVRTKEWWQQQLPGWELDFHGPAIQNVPGRHKGFHGVKK